MVIRPNLAKSKKSTMFLDKKIRYVFLLYKVFEFLFRNREFCAAIVFKPLIVLREEQGGTAPGIALLVARRGTACKKR